MKTLQRKYSELCTVARARETIKPSESDRLPRFYRILFKIAHGVKNSMLLLDHRNPKTGRTDFKFYGYVTRKSEKKIFVVSALDSFVGHAFVISGQALELSLFKLSEFIETGGSVEKSPA